MRFKFILAAAVFVLGFSAFATTPALARGPKPGGGGGGTTGGSYSCSASSNPVTLGTAYSLNGSGFANAGYLTVLTTASGGGTSSSNPYVQLDGTFSIPSWASNADSMTASVYHQAGGKQSLLTSCTYVVR